VVSLRDEDLASPAAVDAAIADHQRRTGWTGPVIVAPAEVTVDEWVKRYEQVRGSSPS
jgi:hypothetical protein